VDDLTSTLKLPKTDGGKKNPLSFQKIKEITTFMLKTLEHLEELLAKHVVVTDFILRMKNIVIKPMHKLNLKISKLTVLQAESITDTVEFKFLKEAESAYETTRSQILLVTVRVLQCVHQWYGRMMLYSGRGNVGFSDVTTEIPGRIF
jgi:hypothetical protein